MDRESFVAQLNEDLETEYQSIVQYIQHIASVKGAEYLSTLDELAPERVAAQSASELTTSPPARVPMAHQVWRLIESLMNLTEPSAIIALTPPGW